MAETLVDNKLELIRFEAKSFMGIDQENPIVLDFSRLRKKKNVTILEGNQGVGKSSTLTALMYALGAELDFKKENIVNLKDDKVNIEFEFAAKGKKYRVKATKTKFSLEAWNEDVDLWVGVGEPKATLKKLLGPVATSPMFLKELDGKRQIKWVRDNFTKDHSGVGRKPKEETIQEELAQRTKARTEANREYTRVKAALEGNEMYQNFEANQELYKKPVTVESAKTELQQANVKKQQLDSAKSALVNLNSTKLHQMGLIQQLEQELARMNKEYENTITRIETGEKWVKENESEITTEYNQAYTKYENINREAIAYNEWQRVLSDKEIMDQFQQAVIELDAQKDALRNELLALTKKYLPKMKGLELKLATGLDDDKEGLFYEGKSLAQISESELWTIFLAICEHNDVNFVVIENITSLGSNAIQVLNDLAAKDVKIFASEQNRKQNSLQITFTDKID